MHYAQLVCITVEHELSLKRVAITLTDLYIICPLPIGMIPVLEVSPVIVYRRRHLLPAQHCAG